MEVITSRKLMQEISADRRKKGFSIGFVPTMGSLHKGHLSLVKKSKLENDLTVVSIFVNPSQFGENEDFDKYPRNLDRDKDLLMGLADLVFAPDVNEIYPNGQRNEQFSFKISSRLNDCLCGKSRPTHFSGVAQVISKLFNIVKPNSVYFGQKDYQQTIVIKYLIDELFFDLRMIVCPTFREKEGLAMSSRNIYLSSKERKEATVLFEALSDARQMLLKGEQNASLINQKIRQKIQNRPGIKIDYVEILDAATLESIDEIKSKKIVIAVAAYFGSTRLIDNILFPE